MGQIDTPPHALTESFRSGIVVGQRFSLFPPLDQVVVQSVEQPSYNSWGILDTAQQSARQRDSVAAHFGFRGPTTCSSGADLDRLKHQRFECATHLICCKKDASISSQIEKTIAFLFVAIPQCQTMTRLTIRIIRKPLASSGIRI